MPAQAQSSYAAPGYRQGQAPDEGVDYQADELPAWRPRNRGAGDGTFRGGNADLGTPETVADDLREKLLEMDELLSFAAETNRRYRSAKTQRILMEAELLKRCPAKWMTVAGSAEDPLEISLKSASAREQWLSIKAAEVRAEEADCKIAWELVCKAANVQQAQLDGIRSIGARIATQQSNDGREEWDSYTNQTRRQAAQSAGRRMPGR